jgi:hypothetical protein
VDHLKAGAMLALMAEYWKLIKPNDAIGFVNDQPSRSS